MNVFKVIHPKYCRAPGYTGIPIDEKLWNAGLKPGILRIASDITVYEFSTENDAHLAKSIIDEFFQE